MKIKLRNFEIKNLQTPSKNFKCVRPSSEYRKIRVYLRQTQRHCASILEEKMDKIKRKGKKLKNQPIENQKSKANRRTAKHRRF